jgi:hypothetical protein
MLHTEELVELHRPTRILREVLSNNERGIQELFQWTIGDKE